MRLLNTTTLTFKEYSNSPDELSYCILSHRWATNPEDEVDYHQMAAKNMDLSNPGWKKISGACELASQLDYDWIWIDTCCINRQKDNGAELSEAINSMFNFYLESDLCIVYLADVPTLDEIARKHSGSRHRHRRIQMEAFRKSNWFERGWTLQELLAPDDVSFYDSGFNKIGSRYKLAKTINECTGIDVDYLEQDEGQDDFREASVATKMSWASDRKTTKPEDQAYCLLGIFGVTMLPAYGECERAFFRLQLEILRLYNDESIFAWISHARVGPDACFGLLAESPQDFADSEDVRRVRVPGVKRPPARFIAGCVQISQGHSQFSLAALGRSKKGDVKITLACQRWNDFDGESGWKNVVITLRETNKGWFRIKCNRFIHTTNELDLWHHKTYNVTQPIPNHTVPAMIRQADASSSSVRRRNEEAAQRKKQNSKNWDNAFLTVGTGALILAGVEKFEKSRSKVATRRRQDFDSESSSQYDSSCDETESSSEDEGVNSRRAGR